MNQQKQKYTNLLDTYDKQIPFEVSLRSLFMQLESHKANQENNIIKRRTYLKIKSKENRLKKMQQVNNFVGSQLTQKSNYEKQFQQYKPQIKSNIHLTKHNNQYEDSKSKKFPFLSKFQDPSCIAAKNYNLLKNTQSQLKRCYHRYTEKKYQRKDNKKLSKSYICFDDPIQNSGLNKSCIIPRKPHSDKVKIFQLINLYSKKKQLLRTEKNNDTNISKLLEYNS